MSIYSAMARYYDVLTGDVPYDRFAFFIEKIFQKYACKPELVLDLACGTGSLTRILAEKGYDMIGADYSCEMLMQAQMKCADLENPPTFIRQSMTDLDLYGTVDAVVCCLDSVNYLSDPKDLDKAFSGVSLFLNPGGLFIFDMNTEYKLRSIGGSAFVRDEKGIFCVWQAIWNQETRLAEFIIDLFDTEDGVHYNRSGEDHVERAYSQAEIRDALEKNGMELLKVYGELKFRSPKDNEERIFYIARKR